MANGIVLSISRIGFNRNENEIRNDCKPIKHINMAD